MSDTIDLSLLERVGRGRVSSERRAEQDAIHRSRQQARLNEKRLRRLKRRRKLIGASKPWQDSNMQVISAKCKHFYRAPHVTGPENGKVLLRSAR